MYEHALTDNLLEAVLLEGNRDLYQFYCVEIPVEDRLIYQFKIWHTGSPPMSVLVKDNSKFLSFVENRSKFNMKYYSEDVFYPYQEFVTEIRDISLQECGRLRGHYLVGLDIIEEAEDQKINGLIFSGDHNFPRDIDS